MIYRLENFPASSGRAHNQQKFDKNPDTLMIVDPKTRPPPMWSGKKVLRHLFQKNEMLFKNILQSMPLKDSPHTELVRSLEDNLQNEIFFYYKKPLRFCRVKQTNTRTSGW